MPRSESVEPKKRRVRTGCLTCRRRRRKCDEKKPRCNNCVSKNLECRYGVNVIFIDDKGNRSSAIPHKSRSSTDELTSDHPESNSAQQDHHLEKPKEATALSSYQPEQDQDFGYLAFEDVSQNQPTTNFLSPQSLPPSIPPSRLASFSSPPVTTTLSHRNSLNEYTSPNSQPRSNHAKTPSSTTSIDSKSQRFLPPGATIKLKGNTSKHVSTPDKRPPTELDLLCIYRYHLAPWLDLGDPASYFAVKVVMEALDSPTLYKVILALSTVKLTLCPYVGSDVYSTNSLDATALLKSARLEQSSSNSDSSVISLMLLTADLLLTVPTGWASMMQTNILSLTNNNTMPIYLTLAETELWIVLRFDLAAALVSKSSPSVAWQTFSLIRHTRPGSTPSDFFLASLSLLAQAITLSFPHEHEQQYRSETPNSSRWTSVWNECQTWYTTRPAILQQILDIPSIELDQLEISSPPTSQSTRMSAVMFTSSMALLANSIYHITSLLLLLHKPRLLKPKGQSGFASATSPIWHAQRIVGIAASCHESHCWDPVLVSGVILASSRMSHERQRKTIIEVLTRAQDLTGMKLGAEIEKLKSSEMENYA